MSTPNDGSMTPSVPAEPSSNNSSQTVSHTTNVTVNGSSYTVNITGEESASDLEAEKK